MRGSEDGPGGGSTITRKERVVKSGKGRERRKEEQKREGREVLIEKEENIGKGWCGKEGRRTRK